MSIEQLIDKLIDEKRWKKNCRYYFKQWNRDYNFLYNNFEKGEVEEIKIFELLQNSETNEKLRYLLPDIIFLIDEHSFTDDIIEYCVDFYCNKSYQSTLLCVLAHLNLSNYQLEIINEKTDTSEAFFQLLLRKLNNQNVSATEVELFIKENKRFINNLKMFIADANCYEKNLNSDVDKSKIAVVGKLVKYYNARE